MKPKTKSVVGSPRLRSIDDPIAAATWVCIERGERVTVQISIGRPQPLDADLWSCPLLIDGFCPPTRIFGVGAVDSLLNAMKLVERFIEERGAQPAESGNNTRARGPGQGSAKRAATKKRATRKKRATP